MPLVAATHAKEDPNLLSLARMRYFGACPEGVASRSGTRHPSIGRRARHAHMDHPSRFQFYYEEGKERPKEQVSHLQVRHRPRYSPRDCGGTCTTFGLVAPGCVPSSCTSEWFAYTRVSPISTVPRECAQLTRRRLFVAISSPQGDRFRGDLWLVGGGL